MGYVQINNCLFVHKIITNGMPLLNKGNAITVETLGCTMSNVQPLVISVEPVCDPNRGRLLLMRLSHVQDKLCCRG